jgi:hypothetical protein
MRLANDAGIIVVLGHVESGDHRSRLKYVA